MDFKKFSTEDFALNKQFREWVEKPDKASNQFWHKFLMEHPEKIEAVKKAKDIVLKINFRRYRLSSEEVDDLWNNIWEGNKHRTCLQGPENVMPLHPLYAAEQHLKNKPVPIYLRRDFQRIAASLVGIMMIVGLGWYFILNGERQQIYATAYGETMKVRLPDGSVAILNANSTLKVPLSWAGDDARQVWLEGEAFFHVEETSKDDNLKMHMSYKFVVHSEGVTVQVLGTKFNVNSRHEKVQVVLEHGKVKVRWKDEKLLMQPGDLVEVNKEGGLIFQKKVDPEIYTSWKENRLLCDGTPISELIKVIEDRFGHEVVINDKALKDIKVSGTIPLDNIAVFNQVLSELIKAEVRLEENKVLIVKQ